ncbi:MAG: DNA polymerase III subunit gamma/tau [Rikenellaceae bacterium]
MVATLPEFVKRTTPTTTAQVEGQGQSEGLSEVKKERQGVVVQGEMQISATPPKAAELSQMPKAKVTTKRPSILNLGELLSQEQGAEGQQGLQQGQQNNSQQSGGAEQMGAACYVDAASGEKLEAARGAIIEYLGQWRPRFVAVFEPMSISGNVINIVVPTTELRDEILRNKIELLTKVVAIAQIKGSVELNIDVNETIKSMKPIKLEDRIAYIMELNPLIAELRDALDLDVEG